VTESTRLDFEMWIFVFYLILQVLNNKLRAVIKWIDLL